MSVSTKRGQSSSGWPTVWLSFVFLAFYWLLPAPVAAFTDKDIDKLLALPEPPHGVVFEIVEGDEGALEEILPKVKDAIERIRAQHPKTEFAVVSHGREEFALQTRHQDEYAVIHQEVQSLVADDVPVHICETHAGWYGVTAEDFPEYVNVAPTGPGQVNLYRELGYHLIIVD